MEKKKRGRPWLGTDTAHVGFTVMLTERQYESMKAIAMEEEISIATVVRRCINKTLKALKEQATDGQNSNSTY